jgi:hypothetical protein
MRYRIGFVTVVVLACAAAIALVMLLAAGPILASDDYQQINADGFGSGAAIGEITCSAVWNGLVYFGTRNSSGGCNIWRYDGGSWSQFVSDGFGDPNNTAVTCMLYYSNSLYVGTENLVRRSFNMGDALGGDTRAAIVVRCLTSRKKILVERSMYWNHRGAGTDTIGGYSD